MNRIILSTAYLPPVEYFASLLHAGDILIEGEESYCKQTYRNRCNIAGPNGRQALTIPVLHHKVGKTPIRDVQIDYGSRWQSIHWRSIEAAYNKSPFFDFYREDMKSLFLTRRKFLLDHNNDILELCLKLARIKTEIRYTRIFQKEYDDRIDKRSVISPKKPKSNMNFPRYPQVFEQNRGFIPNLSIIDLLFNRGPDAAGYLESVR